MPTTLRCSSVEDQLRTVQAGLGITVLTCNIGDFYEDLVRVSPSKLYSSTDLWLLAHPELRDTQPVKSVFDFIAAQAKTDREQLLGKPAGLA